MKNKGIVVPITLAGLVLILVLITAVTKNDFKRNPAETLLLAKSNLHLIAASSISALPPDQIAILKIGAGNVPAIFSKLNIFELDGSKLLSPETRSLLTDVKKMKVITSTNLPDAVKAWTFFTRLGYSNLRIYDPDLKETQSKNDPIPQGNETFQYTFKPDKD